MWNDLQEAVLNEKQSIKHYKWYTLNAYDKDMCVHVYVCGCVCMCICVYTQTYIYRHINIYVCVSIFFLP